MGKVFSSSQILCVLVLNQSICKRLIIEERVDTLMIRSSTSKFASKMLSYTLVFTVSVGLFSGSVLPVQLNAEETSPMFKTQVGGVFDGMPLFDGVPEHLDPFVDTLFNYTGLEGPAVYVAGARNIYTLKSGPNAGKKYRAHCRLPTMIKEFQRTFLRMLDWDSRGIRTLLLTSEM